MISLHSLVALKDAILTFLSVILSLLDELYDINLQALKFTTQFIKYVHNFVVWQMQPLSTSLPMTEKKYLPKIFEMSFA